MAARGAERPERPQPVSEHRYFLRRLGVLVVLGLMMYGGYRVVETVAVSTSASDGALNNVPAATATTTTALPAQGDDSVAMADTGAPADDLPVVERDTESPSAQSPARVLIVGDSHAGTYGPFLELLIDGEHPEVAEITDITLDYVVSSGLARPDFHDWPRYLTELLDEHQPDIVIAAFGGNDAQGLTRPCDGGAGSCSPSPVVGFPVGNEDEWIPLYVERVHAITDIVADAGATTIWVGIANAESESMTAGLVVQNRAVEQALEERPDVLFVDTWRRFGGPSGGYAEYVVDPRDGRAKPIRASDGSHLNRTGAEILALDVFHQLEVALIDLGADLGDGD